MIAFTPHAYHTNAVGVDATLNVDGLGAKPSVWLASIGGSQMALVLGNALCRHLLQRDAEWILPAEHDGQPLRGSDWRNNGYLGTTAPTTPLHSLIGQAISRTTYAALFTIMSRPTGVGDGSTTFNLPDFRGRVPVGKDNMGGSAASRVTTAGSGLDGTTLGAASGTETNTLSTTELPTHTHAGTTDVEDAGHSHTQQGTFVSGTESATHTHTTSAAQISAAALNYGGGVNSGVQAANQTITSSTESATHTHSTTISGSTTGTSASHRHPFTTGPAGTGTAFSNMQPTIITNYIIRII
jgi:microcystin-dependent protein